jgi:hypothetical protein
VKYWDFGKVIKGAVYCYHVEHKVISSLHITNKLCIYCDDITTLYYITGLWNCADSDKHNYICNTNISFYFFFILSIPMISTGNFYFL